MPDTKLKSILGYQLQKQLGAGGFGEVWSAIAPGGLPKAVKLVYGYHDEHRAQTELKSLERIKQIRHPFLLSLERIDVVDGQLVVVCELADGGLNDVHRRYIKTGQVGIPRDELLAYLHDAAEALDYLSSKHSLQHLDVKPENLLVIGDHIKLADFGLVKDIRNTNQSMVTGMTPIYAAPEIFNGQPDSNSDQYSLAVVYQEMLTSTRPFEGVTSAQLAAQHLREKPNIRSLPKSDQPLIAKALSKDPRNRFASCTEMIEELQSRKLRKKKVYGIHQRAGDTPTHTSTSVVPNSLHDQTEIVQGDRLPFQQQPVQKLDPPAIDETGGWLQPTLVISIGGTAAQSAQKLKTKIVGRHGGTENLSSFKMICLDTDLQMVSGLQAANPHSGLGDDEILGLKLKKSEYYRNKSSSTLKWLSRRWIYNIPKSCQTEGIRPLGRLAFADHFDEICDKFKSSIEEICRPENIARSSETLEALPGEKISPRIIVMNSMNGGASGMLFDVAYLLRTLLIEEGYESESVTAILSHSIGSKATKTELSTANALATLTELRHFVDYGYPGDDTLGIPEFEDQPFGHLYFHELGEENRQGDLRDQVNQISEWLYLNCFTDCARFFDACRGLEQNSDQFNLRTFGMSVKGPAEDESNLNYANRLAIDLIQRWTKNTISTVKTLEHPGFDVPNAEQVLAIVDNALTDNEMGGLIQGVFETAKQALEATDKPSNVLPELYDQVFGLPVNERHMSYELTSLEANFEVVMRNLTDDLKSGLEGQLYEILQAKELRLESIGERVEIQLQETQRLSDQYSGQILEALANADVELQSIESARIKAPKRFSFEEALERYHEYRLNSFMFRYCVTHLSELKQSFTSFLNWLTGCKRNLASIESQFVASEFGVEESDGEFDLSNEISRAVDSEYPERLDSFEEEVFRRFVKTVGGFNELLSDSHLLQRTLPKSLRELALIHSAESYNRISIDRLIVNKGLSADLFFKWINEELNLALPVAKNSGGNVRLMIGVPRNAPRPRIHEIIAKHFGVKSSCCRGTCGDLVFCFEGEGISLASLAATMISDVPRSLDLSTRLTCRQDIEWSRIHDLL